MPFSLEGEPNRDQGRGSRADTGRCADQLGGEVGLLDRGRAGPDARESLEEQRQPTQRRKPAKTRRGIHFVDEKRIEEFFHGIARE
jgi:hypothetical protein